MIFWSGSAKADVWFRGFFLEIVKFHLETLNVILFFDGVSWEDDQVFLSATGWLDSTYNNNEITL